MGPVFDVALIACWTWPVLVAVLMVAGNQSSLHASVLFAQAYVISTSHRWITLGMVFLDRERFRERARDWIQLLVLVLLAVAWATLRYEGLALLIAVDYLWNAWHFAAQHHGIWRIYARAGETVAPAPALLMGEKVLFRVFVLFVILRATTFPVHPAERFGWMHGLAAGFAWLPALDLVVLALPVLLMMRELSLYRHERRGSLAYLGSICLLYTSTLVAAHAGLRGFALLLAITLVHAVEYLAIVSWALGKRHGRSERGFFATVVRHGVLSMSVFLGVTAVLCWWLAQASMYYFLLLTFVVSYLHYLYDGMIWKAPKRKNGPAEPALQS